MLAYPNELFSRVFPTRRGGPMRNFCKYLLMAKYPHDSRPPPAGERGAPAAGVSGRNHDDQHR
jgi:hypothetical protein